jgi:hypothetical protein
MDPYYINAWYVSILMLLLLTNIFPNGFTFICAVIVFYCPFVILALYMLTFLPQEIWYGFGMMCLFLWTWFVILNYP